MAQRVTIRLQNSDGSHHRFILRGEASELLAKKRARRVYAKKSSAYTLRLIPDPPPSDSHETATIFTLCEMHAVAGIGHPLFIRASRVKLRDHYSPAVHGIHSAAVAAAAKP